MNEPVANVHAAAPHLAIYLECKPQVAGIPSLCLTEASRPRWSAIARQFLERHWQWASLRLAVISTLPDDDADAQRVFDTCALHGEQVTIGQNTAVASARTWAANLIANIARRPAMLTDLAGAIAGEPVFVCGAGPSLDLALEYAPELRERGRIFAVSNAAPALIREGLMPDAVFSCESLDQSPGLQAVADATDLRAHRPSLHALDLTAGSANWQVPADCHAAIASHEPNVSRYVLALGGIPLGYTGSVSCAATSAAIALGASSIVLLGQDLGYGRTGRMYATETVHADVEARPQGAGALAFTGATKRRDAVQRLERPRFRHWTRSPDARPRSSDHSFETFRGWFERAAARRTLINASEHGVDIAGTLSLPIREVIASLPPRRLPPLTPPTRVSRERVAAVLDDLEQQASEHLRRRAFVPGADFPLLNMYTLASVLDAQARDIPADKIAVQRNGVREGCEQVLESVRQAREVLG